MFQRYFNPIAKKTYSESSPIERPVIDEPTSSLIYSSTSSSA